MRTEGPLGFPMPDHAARQLDVLLRSLPRSSEHAYRHAVTARDITPGERWDVSWISTESIDRTGEVVLAGGMDDSQFQLNPLVTLGHDYSLQPVGTSVWRRQVSEAGITGVKARTDYPPRPSDWPEGQPWLPDQVFSLVRAGLLRGKSIGFLPLRVHTPTETERSARGWGDVRLVIDKWLLLEYACVSLPANQDALVEAVAKGDLLPAARVALGLERMPAFTPWTEIERAASRHIANVLPTVVTQAVSTAIERLRGRV